MQIVLTSEECKSLIEAIVDCDLELFNKIKRCAESDSTSDDILTL